MQTKSLVKISIVSGGNVVNAVLGFLFLTAVAKYLSVEEFGKYALLTSLLVFLSKIMDLGTNSVYVAESIKSEKDLKNTFFSLKVILFFVSLPVSLAVLSLFGLINIQVIFAFIFGLLAYGVNLMLFAFFQKTEKFLFVVLINSIPAIIKGGFATLILLGIYTPQLNQVFAIFSLSMLSCGLFYFFLPAQLRRLTLDFKETKQLLISSIYGGGAQAIGFGWAAIANSTAKIMKTFTDVGIFSLANKIANIFTLISLGIFTVLLPKNAKRKRKTQKYNLRETASLATGVLLLALFAMAISEYFVTFVFGEKFAESTKLLDILILASAVTAIHTFMENYFFIEQKTKALLNITLVRLALFFTGAAILIPLYELTGLAIAQLIAAITALLITTIYIYTKNELLTVEPR